MIEVVALRQEFDGREVLRGIDLSVAKGDLIAIMGSSGGGKTTLLRCISGLQHPTSGSVRVDGIDVVAAPDAARMRMGMVFQSAALFDYLTVRENVRFALRRRGLRLAALDEIVNASLSRVGLAEDGEKMPAELSGGMRKRAGLARALALQPAVMLYDEPTTGLDPITTYSIDLLMKAVRDELGMTSLVVSHDVSSVFRVADRIAFLHKGTLAFFGTPAEFAASDHEAIVDLLQKSQPVLPSASR